MNKYLVVWIATAVLWNALLSESSSEPSPCINSVKSFRQGDAIVIGKVPNHPYVVIVPGKSEQLLNVVRHYVSDAFLAQHRLGTYVYAAGFVDKYKAECFSSLLRSHRLDARVVYFP